MSFTEANSEVSPYQEDLGVSDNKTDRDESDDANTSALKKPKVRDIPTDEEEYDDFFKSLSSEERQLYTQAVLSMKRDALVAAELAKPLLNTTETGNAELVIKKYGARFLHCPGVGFFVWVGNRWCLDAQNTLGKWVRRTLEALPETVRGDPHEVRAWMKKSLSKSRREAVIALLKVDGPQVSIEELDAHPWYFNLPNGTLDLRTGELRPHSPQDLITEIAPVEFDTDAQCPLFRATVLKICGGDAEFASYIQKICGYVLSGSTREQCLFLLLGKGANGKSLLLEILGELLGSYQHHIRPATLLRRESGAMTNDIAKLRAARMVTASETNRGAQWDEALLKAATGDNQLTARFLRQEEFTFTPHFKILLATNHEPRVSGTEDGIWRRFRLLKFQTRFWDADQGETGPPELQADKKLQEKLREELPGILNWALEGCLAWQKEGLKTPICVQEDTQNYRHQNDSLAQFFEDEVELSSGYREAKSDFYDAYCVWASANGFSPLSKNEIGSQMTDKKVEEGKSDGTRFWKGLRLKQIEAGETI